MFKRLSEKIGFTGTEAKVVIFLLSTLVLGFGAKLFLRERGKAVTNEYDYSTDDSLFNTADFSSEKGEKNLETSNKIVDYKREVLDFKKTNFSNIDKKKLPPQKSININKAETNELISLPGIGEKTAEEIIAFRKKNGNFHKLEDIIKVKGIGSSKFSKIKKYIFILKK